MIPLLVYMSNYIEWVYEDGMQWWYQHLGRQTLECCWKASRRWTYRGSWGSEKANATGLDSKKLMRSLRKGFPVMRQSWVCQRHSMRMCPHVSTCEWLWRTEKSNFRSVASNCRHWNRMGVGSCGFGGLSSLKGCDPRIEPCFAAFWRKRSIDVATSKALGFWGLRHLRGPSCELTNQHCWGQRLMRPLGLCSDFSTISEWTEGPSTSPRTAWELYGLFRGPLRGRCVDYTESDRKEHMPAITDTKPNKV